MEDPLLPKLEAETRRRRRRALFRGNRVPIRMLVPNFFTLLGLCAGLTSIRMSIEGNWDFALYAIVFAAFLDGIDGRIARLLKASSRFGAELDSLADFVNFGVAPAILIFTWSLGDTKSFGWICVMIFALASALRLARFNVALDDDKPRWQSNFFQGVPTPAAAIIVLLPLYLSSLGFDPASHAAWPAVIAVYTLTVATLMVASVPTYSGKLMGERIGSEWVLPLFIAGVAFVSLLVTYPQITLLGVSIAYFVSILFSWRRFRKLSRRYAGADAAGASIADPVDDDSAPTDAAAIAERSRNGSSVVEMAPRKS